MLRDYMILRVDGKALDYCTTDNPAACAAVEEAAYTLEAAGVSVDLTEEEHDEDNSPMFDEVIANNKDWGFYDDGFEFGDGVAVALFPLEEAVDRLIDAL